MDIKIVFTDDPAAVLSKAGKFLASQPVLHNLILTILHARVAGREPGRYWIAMNGESAVGVVLQSPPTYPATLTPMEPYIIAAMVDAMAAAKIALPGINGDATTAAAFAGQWTERCKSAATPFQGNRLYELLTLGESPPVKGKLRQAGPADHSLMIDWSLAFSDEVHEPSEGTEARVDGWIAARQLWLWEDDESMSIAVAREGFEGVVRVSGVYTPPEKRGHGYAEACVYALSKHLLDHGYRCILYTDLANPTSNSIYRRIGYRAVAEVLRYRFE